MTRPIIPSSALKKPNGATTNAVSMQAFFAVLISFAARTGWIPACAVHAPRRLAIIHELTFEKPIEPMLKKLPPSAASTCAMPSLNAATPPTLCSATNIARIMPPYMANRCTSLVAATALMPPASVYTMNMTANTMQVAVKS